MAEEVYMQVVAVIDAKTTQICLHAAGQIQPVGQEVADKAAEALLPDVEPVEPSLFDGPLLEGDEYAQELAEAIQLEEWDGMAIQQYQGNAYTSINATLRSGGNGGSYSDVVEKMGGMWDSADSTYKNGILYRGLNVSPEYAGDVVGRVFKDKGIVSTTLRRSVAEEFTRNGAVGYQLGLQPDSVMLRFAVPGYTKMIPAGYGRKEAFFDGRAEMSDVVSEFLGHEGEILLQPNTEYKIVRDYVDDSGIRVLDAEIIPRNEDQPTFPVYDLGDGDDYEYDDDLDDRMGNF